MSQRTTPTTVQPNGEAQIKLSINGQAHQLRVAPSLFLLDLLRDHLHLHGTRKGCDHGQCGACTVLVEGQRVLSCLSLAISHAGEEVVTIEGLSEGRESLHAVQQAFLDCDGLQCGYCTPGQIMSAVGLLREGHARSEAEVREEMSGNICRCGAYPQIVAAVRSILEQEDGKK